MNDNNMLVQTENLSVNFPVRGGMPFKPKKYIQAVTGVSIRVRKGETFGLVGESGCGKTTLGNAVLGILEPTSGRVLFKGKDINSIPRKEFSKLRREMQMIFQDPYSSLNPRFDVYSIIAEPFVIRGELTKAEIKAQVLRLLKLVGLDEQDLYRHATDFSGGQRQRIGIARAIALNPEFLVCDEPVSALDVSVHAQILNLLMDLQDQLGLTYLFISHNLAVVKNVCSSIAVMYLGKVVETGPTETVFRNPLHPYTRALLSAVPNMDMAGEKKRIILKGEIPTPIDPPPGCRFSPRCPETPGGCFDGETVLKEAEPGHFTACRQY
jgi:oligopeptide transport system ATP-binding protein